MGDIAKSETAFDDTTDEKPFVDLDASELTAVDINLLLGSERRNHREMHREKYVLGFERLRASIFKCFKALNLCRSTDMGVQYNESSQFLVRRVSEHAP